MVEGVNRRRRKALLSACAARLDCGRRCYRSHGALLKEAARARPRRKLFQPATLEVAGQRARVHLLDLSESGCLLNMAAPPAAGVFVMLDAGTVRRAARVAWVRGTRLGVAFNVALTAAEVEAVLALGARLPEAAGR